MKIVLTGGPSAGKTSAVELLARTFFDELIPIPESASILYRGGFPRSNGTKQRRRQQVAIYHVQKELENIASIDLGEKALICDRGSLDGLAYWPSDQASYFDAVGSSLEAEIASYDWVLHLDTVPGDEYRMTSLRTESKEEALTLNERIKSAWRMHPRRLVIPNSTEFISKMNLAVEIVQMILSGFSYEQIQRVTGLLNNESDGKAS